MRDRYDLDDSAAPPNGRAAERGNASVAAVDDPLEPGARVQVTVNRRVDVLENERAQGLITNTAYLAGRFVQALFERSRGARGGSAGPWREGSVTDAWSHDAKLVRVIHDVQTLERYLTAMRGVLGQRDTEIVYDMLGDGLTYAQVAARRAGRNTARTRAYVAARFRDSLTLVALYIDDWR
jgi:hypothetical protein